MRRVFRYINPSTVSYGKSIKSFSSVFKWGKDLVADVGEFRRNGELTIDYICDTHKNIDKLPVTTKLEPGFLEKILPQEAPEEGRDFKDVLKDIDEKIIKNYTLYEHPGFYADTSLTSYPAIIGNIISDAYNNPGVSWVANPAGFELERIVLEWMAEEFSIPSNFKKDDSGCVVHLDSGESAAVVALAARNKRRLEYPNQDDKFTYYYSTEANKGASKSTYIANGIARIIPVVWNDKIKNYEMDTVNLKKTIEEDVKAGYIPTLVYASLGNHNTTAIDPIDEISSLCNQHKIWCHIDASVLGNTLLLPEKKYLLKGVDKANSIVIEGNRGLPVGLDSAFFWVDEVKYVFKALNEDFVLYVQFFKDNQAEMTNYHFGTARATKSIRLWMVIKSYGIEGFKQLLNKQLKFGKLFEEKIEKESSIFKILCNTQFNSVIFTLKNESNEDLEKFLEAVNSTQKLLISSGKVTVNGKTTSYAKLCLNDVYITEERVDEVVSILKSCYFDVFKRI